MLTAVEVPLWSFRCIISDVSLARNVKILGFVVSDCNCVKSRLLKHHLQKCTDSNLAKMWIHPQHHSRPAVSHRVTVTGDTDWLKSVSLALGATSANVIGCKRRYGCGLMLSFMNIQKKHCTSRSTRPHPPALHQRNPAILLQILGTRYCFLIDIDAWGTGQGRGGEGRAG